MFDNKYLVFEHSFDPWSDQGSKPCGSGKGWDQGSTSRGSVIYRLSNFCGICSLRSKRFRGVSEQKQDRRTAFLMF